jgi:hypothetical protein
LPTGLSINSTSGLITGTIANAAHNNSPFTATVTANDGSSSASQTFTWTVNPVVTVTNPGNQTNKVGDNVNLQIQASDAKGGTLTYGATNLPGGLTINASTGLISGTVATGANIGSPFTVNVAATDGTFNGSQTFSWTINP